MPDDECASTRALREHRLIENVEMGIVKDRGEITWISVTAAPIPLEGYGVAIAYSDIGERKRAEEALWESEKLYRSLFANMLNGFAYCRMLFEDGQPQDFIYLTVNAAFEAQTGLKDVVGRKVTEVIPGFRETDRQLLETYGRVAVTGQPEHLEVFVEGLQMWFSISVYSPARDYFVAVFDAITERKRTEEALRVKDWAIESAISAVSTSDMEGNLTYVNPAFLKLWGYNSPAEVVGKPAVEFWQMGEKAAEAMEGVRTTGGWIGELVARGKDGAPFDVQVAASLVVNSAGQPVCMEAWFADVTERKRAEEAKAALEGQLHQARKMESVGRLAGGVAHDFNNMLGVILGRAELALRGLGPSDPRHDDLKEILAAGKRSAEIVRQLLAFARKQTIAPVVLDLNETVESMLKMLRPLIGEDIDLAWLPGGGLWPVRMDPSQVNQVMANLSINARDAIGGVGCVTVTTRNVALDEAACAGHAGFVPGECVLLTVSDNGCGMDTDTQANIFEPFFTTKGVGQGSGLGLATVYGIVTQNGGFIGVDSEPGKGTTFDIYLPRHEGHAVGTRMDIAAAIPVGGSETVLIVEDEVAILTLSRTILDTLGYTVLTARTTLEARRLADAHLGSIQLLITDVVMPDMNGRELAEELQRGCPTLRCLFMSGYAADVIAARGVLAEDTHFIQKPFSVAELAAKVREVLGRE